MQKTPEKTVEELEKLLELWMDGSIYISGEFEEKIPELKKARTLTGAYFFEKIQRTVTE